MCFPWGVLAPQVLNKAGNWRGWSQQDPTLLICQCHQSLRKWMLSFEITFQKQLLGQRCEWTTGNLGSWFWYCQPFPHYLLLRKSHLFNSQGIKKKLAKPSLIKSHCYQLAFSFHELWIRQLNTFSKHITVVV